VNEQIRLTPVQVVDQDGNMLGEMQTKDALLMAREAGLDLVEVGPTARPPICKIMDYGKMQYEKKKKSSGPKAHRAQLKQIRLRPKIGEHDLEVKVNAARKFLEKHDKVKINVLFRGRENAHRDLGQEMLKEIITSLDDVATVEKQPGMEGRMMSAVLAPRP
jgi:translation initiation factor IF-3